MTFSLAILVKWSCVSKRSKKGTFFKQHGCVFMQVKTGYESGKYAFIIMGHRRWVWDNKNAHVCPETAHSAIMRIDQHRPVGGLGAFAARGASLGVIKGFV